MHKSKRNLKKYIAGVLTIALAAGVCQSYGSMEAMAKEATLPGIEKLVTDTMNAGEVFRILEIVPDHKNASMGYLIGGEEPVTEGRKLSELVSATERQNAMAQLKASIDAGDLKGLAGKDGAFTFSAYEEREDGSGSVELRGHFVFRGEGGHYNYVSEDAQYVMLADGEDYQGTRYDRYSSFSEIGDTDPVKKYIIPTFSMISGNSNKQLQTTIAEDGADSLAYAIGKYALSYYAGIPNGRMDSIDTDNFKADDYVNKELWQRQGSSDDYSYTYLGRIVPGASLPENCTIIGGSTQNTTAANADNSSVDSTVTDTVSDATVSGGDADADADTEEQDSTEDADIEVLEQSVSGNDPVTVVIPTADNAVAQPVPAASGIDENLYILDKNTNTATLWAEKIGETYTFTPAADAYFLQFKVNEAGEYYVSRAEVGQSGDWSLTDNYSVSDTGLYKKIKDGSTQVTVAGEAGFDSTQAYDFIRNLKEDSIGTVRYNGGFDNREWFKKNVLNLSEEDAARLQISVTTLTPEELADLVMTGVDYGITLSDIDMIYLSGQGDYAGAQPDATAAVPEENAAWQMANAVARLAFGIQNDTDTAQNRNNAVRVPVVMDYNFYDSNNKAQNTTMVRLAQTLLLVSDAEVYNALAKEGLNYWNAAGSAISEAGCADKVNKLMQSFATEQGIDKTKADKVNLSTLKDFLTDNVYLNNDENTKYVSSDYLTDISARSNKDNAWVYNAVLQEIRYENFLLQKDNSSPTDLLKEEITKASVTRYILNWYLHRIMVKSKLTVLDLEPCYDYSDTTKQQLQSFVRSIAGVTDPTKMDVAVVNMSSEEFIGKIEDLNATYDLIYLGSRTGMMNTRDGSTVYNDTSMNGLLFTHTGDSFTYSSDSRSKWYEDNSGNRSRLIDDSLKNAKERSGERRNYWNIYSETYRIPGNDMNSTRFEEFRQYIQAGYPVILSDAYLKKLEDGRVIANTTTLDSNSYFYRLINEVVLKQENGQYLYWQKNVFAESQLTQDVDNYAVGTGLTERCNVFCNYLNLSKLSVEWVTDLGETYVPQDIHNGSAKQGELNTSYLQQVDGKYQLQYIFSLKNDAAVSPNATNYDCKLYIDNNADGRFAGSDYVENKSSNATEELAGLSVYQREGDRWVAVNRVNVNGSERYALQSGQTYKIVRILPDDYRGVLPWKLIFYDNSNPLVRTAKSGYTAVKRSGTQPIKVLQLMSDKTIEKYNDNGSLKADSKERWNLEDDSEMQTLFANIKESSGFDVTVKSVDTARFIYDLFEKDSSRNAVENMSDEAARREYYTRAANALQSYDMIILGFGDNYTFGSKDGKLKVTRYNDWKKQYETVEVQYYKASVANMAVAEAVRDYIESGKSVLFTHDSSSYVNSKDTSSQSWYWGYEFNKMIRATVGLDRFGALKEYYSQDSDYYKVLTQQYNYDTIKEPNQSTELMAKEGLTKYTVVRYMATAFNKLKNGRADIYFPVNNAKLRQAIDPTGGAGVNGDYAGATNTSTMLATEVNQGQITNYPYYIGEELGVATTHYQWLQPNMELDKDGDNKNDIVVWYCLSDCYSSKTDSKTNIYNLTRNDVVNNYYIYNMGNVTYSGAGHTKPANGSVEKKLFVNTMIAAYNAGTKAPTISFQNENGTSIDSVYMMYDRANKIVLQQEDKVKVSFKANDYNILASVPEIRVEFYKACGENESGAMEVAGITGKVKLINGVSVTKASDGSSVTAQSSGNTQYYVVSSDTVYNLSVPLSEMGLFSITNNGSDREYTLNGTDADPVEPAGIYAKVTTYYDNGNKKTDSMSVKLSVSVADLFDLN